MDKLKAERRQEGLLKPNSNTDARPGASTARDDAGPDMPSPGNFSGFLSEEVSCEEGEIHGDNPVCRVLLLTSKAFGLVEEVSCDVDKHVADMVNQLFDHGMREDSYKEVVEHKSTKRPGNCPDSSPAECNVQILEALKQADLRMKDDKVAQNEGNAVVAHEVGMINGALALLGHANYRNNLVRHFNIKWEINQKYAHLCSDKSAKQIEESEKLRTKITAKSPFLSWNPGTWKFGDEKTSPFGRTSSRGFASRFQPYGHRRQGQKGDQRLSFPRQDSD
ncbi:hypothetical protein E2C01_061063 [Portunus trituberculatus]|uniref:Uncharacterized protein n=1 Tax=Portunus trituberculatus TaxID=210409 RepID=A0A5B7HDC6_PORTR|nr:hypothetical protein [Portunus trituberculatus]